MPIKFEPSCCKKRKLIKWDDKCIVNKVTITAIINNNTDNK